MATVEENVAHWGSHDWSTGGEEWSETWGGSFAQWFGSILPRVHHFLPCGRALEIASGAGRWSAFLARHCRHLELVDLTAESVELCRWRFRSQDHIVVHQNDGRTLPMIGAGEIDFVFSFDSLVHAELDVIASYLRELERILQRDGAAFLHHSNFAALLAEAPAGLENRHWRAESVSADAVRKAGEAVGLSVVAQELVNWGCPWLTDCFSLVVRPGSRFDRAPARLTNPDFMAEAAQVRRLAHLYGRSDEVPPRRDP